MGNRFAEIAFTPAVQAQQAAHGSRASYQRFAEGDPWNDRLGGVLHLAHALVSHHPDGDLHQVADHRLDIAPHVSHLGEP